MKEKYIYPQINIAHFNLEQVAAAASATMDDLNNTWQSQIENEFTSKARMVEFSDALKFVD